MEEIEYLEEYEDLILPTISSSSVEPKHPENMASVPDDEDSSSIDQDIFESLFDDHSDDDHVLQKKVNPKLNPRRVDRSSMDSIDMLVKDLVGDRLTRDGEQLGGGKSKMSLSSSGPKKVVQKATATVTKARPSTAKQELVSSAAKADSSTRPGKPKSVATVRPTVQSQTQQKRESSVKTQICSRTVNSILSPKVISVVSSTSKSGSSVGLSSLSSRKQISVATSTTTTAESNRSGASTHVAKKLNRSQPTIIKPEKPQSRDPVEDPLSLDNINRTSDSDSDSLSLSDISGDSFVSLSDVDEDGRNVIELSNDSSFERPNLDKIRGTTPSPTVSEDYKSDKDESPAKSLIQIVTSADKSTEPAKFSIKCKDRESIKSNSICEEKSRASCDRKSPHSISVNEFPEKATVVSDIKLSPSTSTSLQTISQSEPTNYKQSVDVPDKLVESDMAAQAKSKASTTEQDENFKHTNKKDESRVDKNGRKSSNKRTVANFGEDTTVQEKEGEESSSTANIQECRKASTGQENNEVNSSTNPSIGMTEPETETTANKQEFKNIENVEKAASEQSASSIKSKGDPKEEKNNVSEKSLKEDKEQESQPTEVTEVTDTDHSPNKELPKMNVISYKNDNEISLFKNHTEESLADNEKICTDKDNVVEVSDEGNRNESNKKSENCDNEKNENKSRNVPSNDLNQCEVAGKYSQNLDDEPSTTNVCVINERNVPPEAFEKLEENSDSIEKHLEQFEELKSIKNDSENLQRENEAAPKNSDSAKEETITKEVNAKKENKKTSSSTKLIEKRRNDEKLVDDKKIVDSNVVDGTEKDKEIIEARNMNRKKAQVIPKEEHEEAKNRSATESRKLRSKARTKESYIETSSMQSQDIKGREQLNHECDGNIDKRENEMRKAESIKLLNTSGEENGLRRRLLRKRGSESSPANDKTKKMKNPDSATTTKEQTANVVLLKRSTKSPASTHKQGHVSFDSPERHKNNLKEALKRDKNNESSSELNSHKKSADLKEKVSPHKSLKPTTESKFENTNKKNVSVHKSEKNKDGKLLKVPEVNKPETVSITTNTKQKIAQRDKDKCMLNEKNASSNLKRERSKVDEPPRKMPRLDPLSKLPQNKEQFAAKEKSVPASKNPKTKKIHVTPQTSPKKSTRIDTTNNDTVRVDTEKKFDQKCLNAENEEIRNFTPEKRTQRLKAIDRDPFKGFEDESESSNLEKVLFIKTALDIQRKSPRVKNVEAERKKRIEEKPCDSSSIKISVKNFSNLGVKNKELEKHTDSHGPETQKTSKNSPALKKSKPSPKKSPGSTVLTFSEWLNQRKIEDVEKSLEQLHEEHINEQNKSMVMEESIGSSNDFNPKRNYDGKDSSTIDVASDSNGAKIKNLNNSNEKKEEKKKKSCRAVRKSEAEMLKNEMPKEMRESGVELLLQEKHPRKSVRSYHSNSSTLTGETSPPAESNVNAPSNEFKVPTAPQRLCVTPLRSAIKIAATYDNSVMGNGSADRDDKEKRGKLSEIFKVRKVRIRLNRSAVACYLKELKKKQPSCLQSESSPEAIELAKDGTTCPTQVKSLDVDKPALKATQKSVSVRSDSMALKRLAVAGPANVYTIPPHQRRAPPPVTISTTSPKDESSPMDTSQKTMSDDQVETCLLTPIKHSTMQAVAAEVRKQQQQLQLEQRRQKLQQLHGVQVSGGENNQQSSTMLARAPQSNDPFTPIEPKEEVLDAVCENSPTPRAAGSLMLNQSALSRTDTSFGVAPAIIDSNGTRLYSFLHPAKYNRSHGNVLLDYCCPNLDGPMSAIDPTRIHTQVQTAVRELPAYIVMTTKLITRADLETNKNVVPASIRQKVEKITANAVTSATSVSNGYTASMPLQTSAPLLKPSISALQKQLPSSTTITPKVLSTNSSGASSTTGVSANSAPPPLTPFSALSNPQKIVQPSPKLPLTTYQRSLLRTQLRQFDARLKKHYSHIAVLTFGKRQEVIENMVTSTSLTPKDVEMSVRLLDEYVAHISPTQGATNSSVSQQQKPSQPNITQKLKTLPVRATTVTQQKKSEQQQLNRQMPIYDAEKNIIGYQYQMPCSTVATVTKSVMPTRSGIVPATPSLKLTSVPSSYASGTPSASSKAPMQDSPRIFYAKSPMQTSTPIVSSAGKTPMGSSITLKNTPRIGRDVTIRQVASSTSTTATGRLPPLTRNPHLSSVSTPVSCSTHSVTTKSITITSTAKRITRQTAADAASKVIVVTQDNGENDQGIDECILPDDNNGPEIKHEKVDDDFIGGN